jgi:cyclase
LAVDGRKRKDGSGWNVFINGGRIDTGIDAEEWVREGVRRGAGEILLTSMDADGTEAGYDLPLCRAVHDAVEVPVIASGGCGRVEDIYEVFEKDCADAALAASLFHYDQMKIQDVKAYLKEKGIPVRL